MSNFASHFKKLNENKKAAFLSVASDDHNWSSVQDRANAIFNSGFVKNKSQVLVIGIGGSSLGLRAFVDLVGNQEQQDRLIFLESPDPIQFHFNSRQFTWCTCHTWKYSCMETRSDSDIFCMVDHGNIERSRFT